MKQRRLACPLLASLAAACAHTQPAGEGGPRALPPIVLARVTVARVPLLGKGSDGKMACALQDALRAGGFEVRAPAPLRETTPCLANVLLPSGEEPELEADLDHKGSACTLQVKVRTRDGETVADRAATDICDQDAFSGMVEHDVRGFSDLLTGVDFPVRAPGDEAPTPALSWMSEQSWYPLFARCNAGDYGACAVATDSLRQGNLQKSEVQSAALLELCENRVSAACYFGGLLAPDSMVRGEMWRQACERGHQPACGWLGVMARESGERDTARTWFEQACTGGDPHACANLAALVLGDDKPDRPRAKTLLEKACEGRYMNGCFGLVLFDVEEGNDSESADRRRNNMLAAASCGLGVQPACTWVGARLLDAGDEGMGAAALEMLGSACDGGDGEACTLLGRAALKGLHQPVDLDRAQAMFEKGCKGGVLRACTGLGMLLEEKATNADGKRRAREMYKLSCDRGENFACNLLAQMARAGTGGPVDLGAAHELLGRACDGELGDACANLADMILEPGGEKPSKKAVEEASALLERACKLDSGRGCFKLASLLEKSPGQGAVERRKDLLTRSCERGFGLGCAAAGDQAREQSDAAGAAALYEQACTLSSQYGCARLGESLINGRGITQDPDRARELLTRSCEEDDALGCYYLARLYEDAGAKLQDGCPDPGQVRDLYKMACSLGHGDACKRAKAAPRRK